MKTVLFKLLVAACGCFTLHAQPVHWNQFRGPNGSGSAPDFAPPAQFDGAKPTISVNIPPASSSPVIWEHRLFITGVEDDRLVTLAIDTCSGQIAWKRQAPKIELVKVHEANTNAASTPCVDEKRVYVYFGSFGFICYDHDGTELWKKRIETPKSMYGMSTSPICRDGQVFLILDDDRNLSGSQLSRSKIIALDGATGELLWETSRPYNRSGWSSPIIWNQEDGAQIVALGNGRAYGYDIVTGNEVWYVNGFSRETISTPILGGGRLYLSASRQGGWGDSEVDPEPFWKAMTPFDTNGNGAIEKEEITLDFTIPLRPELPIGHPGFGIPLPSNPEQRKERQLGFFKWKDRNQDGVWTKEEFMQDMSVGRGRPILAAIRPGGSGDITDSHTEWNLRRGIPEIPSPIYYKERIYLIRSGGLLSCVNAETGEMIYSERLNAPGQYAASPIIVSDRLFLASSEGIISVVQTGDRFEILHQTNLLNEIPATPALDPNSVYIRTKDHLLVFRN
jgi:outer membrane protein assembly factor BamB